MLYLGTPSGPDVRAAMSAGLIGCMTTPAQGNVIPDGALYACDNGKFGCDGKGRNWPGAERWWEWLQRTVERYGADRCLWALAPDVPFDSAATFDESRPWLAHIRELGVPAAFAAQNGCENGLIPWGEFDVLFLAGDVAWKTGPVAERLTREARERGLTVHMGRVNTRERLRTAERFGCETCDGTTLAFGPDRNLPSLLNWLTEVNAPRPLQLIDQTEPCHVTEVPMSHRPPLGASAVWQAVMAVAGDQCQCTGGLCGSQHSKTGMRCIQSATRGRLIVAPADLTLPPVQAAAVPTEQLRAWCIGCHGKAQKRQLESLREQQREAADEPLVLF